MYKIFKFAFVAVLAIVAFSCSKKEDTKVEEATEERELLDTNAADSTEVIGLVVTFMDHLKNGEVVAAIDMLGNSDPDSISSYDALPLDLPQDVKDSYVERYNNIKVANYEIENFNFAFRNSNQVRCKIYDADGHTTMLNFNPIKGVNNWRLTVRDSYRGDKAFGE